MNSIDSTDSQYKHITDECYYKAKTVPELKKLCSILNIDVKMYKNKKKADIIKIIMDNLISTQSQQIDKKTPTSIVINSNILNNDLTVYMEKIYNCISTILSRPYKDKEYYDLLDVGNIVTKNNNIVLKTKQLQMRYGEIWQCAIGNYHDFTNLYTNHISGLDVMSDKRKLIIEIKNRTNTDNASARTANYNKLSKFVKENNAYTAVYGCVNDCTKKNIGSFSIVNINGVSIHLYSGYKFLTFIFGNDTSEIVEFIRKSVNDLHQKIE
jgi:hypothetical protein